MLARPTYNREALSTKKRTVSAWSAWSEVDPWRLRGLAWRKGPRIGKTLGYSMYSTVMYGNVQYSTLVYTVQYRFTVGSCVHYSRILQYVEYSTVQYSTVAILVAAVFVEATSLIARSVHLTTLAGTAQLGVRDFMRLRFHAIAVARAS